MLFPLRTARLTLRPLVLADAPVLAAYSNDPEVARYQDWDLPVLPGAVAEFVASQVGATTVLAGARTQVAVDHEGELAGDISVVLDPGGRQASIGYSFQPRFQGRGFAREAVGALVDALFADVGVHRVTAGVDPRNVASARLLEDLGFRHEGRLAGAALVRGEWLDDDRYALLRTDREAWVTRPTAPPDVVELAEIGPGTAAAVGALRTHRSQELFVATMDQSFRDALFPPLEDGVALRPWLRAVLADGGTTGFVMVADVTATITEPYLWRLLIDRRHQRRGIGRSAVELVAAWAREQGHTGLEVSWHPGRGGPEPFYRRLGFVPTGAVYGDEVAGRLDLGPAQD